MQSKNLLNNFKRILGEYCAINQFVELSKRSFLIEHPDLLSDREKFIQFAHSNSVTLTDYDPYKMTHSISLSYIVNVHLCFETFLKELYQIIKKYGQNPLLEKTQEESWLNCVYRNVYVTPLTDNIKPLYAICEYYRLVRNTAVHDLCDIKTHIAEFKKLSIYDFKKDSKFSKLNAPNTFENISFDDFVMFSRTCIEIATSLYRSVEFNYLKIIADVSSHQITKWKKLDSGRRNNSICLYLKSNFKDSSKLQDLIPDIVELILARSSNG